MRALLLTGVVGALVGLAAVCVVGVAGAVRDRAARQEIDNRAALVSAAAEGLLDRYVDALSLTAGGLGATPSLTAGAFARITAPLRERALGGVPSIAFVVAARDDQIAAT